MATDQAVENRIAAAQQEVAALADRMAEARAIRDAHIQHALDTGMSAYRIAKLTGLTQRAVHMVRDADRETA